MKYHKTCSTALFNKSKTQSRSSSTVPDNSTETAGAFCNLIQYITIQLEEGVYNFKHPILAKLYQTFRDAVGIPTSMNATLLKDKLTEYFKTEALWVKRDGKTFSLCFHSALQHDAAMTTVEQFKIIAQCA